MKLLKDLEGNIWLGDIFLYIEQRTQAVSVDVKGMWMFRRAARSLQPLQAVCFVGELRNLAKSPHG